MYSADCSRETEDWTQKWVSRSLMCAALMAYTVFLVFESDGHEEAVGCELRIRQWHKGLVAISEVE